MPQTTKLLLALTGAMEKGSLFLVVDSAGSYSSVSLGSGGVKRYPMLWLLEHTVLKLGAVGEEEEEGKGKCEVVVREEGRWWRWERGKGAKGEGVRYALGGGGDGEGERAERVELEDMRCLIWGVRKL